MSTTTHRTTAALAAGLALAALLALVLTLASSTKHSHETSAWDVDTATDQPADCGSVAAADYTDDQIAALISQGWYGDPTDQEERLYAPSC